jgi:uncharacterized glyoxalase superfamily protein PhnB
MAFAPPKGWPRISSSLTYEDPRKAIDFLCKAFGFEVQLLVDGEGGDVAHSQLVVEGGGLIMIGSGKGKMREWRKSPRAVGGANTQTLMMFVADVDAHFANAREVGAKIVSEPSTTDHGQDYWADRSYECEDLEGHHWYFVQRVR